MDNEFPAIFQHIRELYKAHAPAGVVLHDEPGRYSIGTHHLRPKDGYRLWFGSVEIKKNYVSAHLMPVYVHPDLLASISPALRKRMQGKACFNFKVKDDALLAELGSLITRGAERFTRDGSLRMPLPPDSPNHTPSAQPGGGGK
jgi:hypothetical protein